jgi:hypothetical protein
MLVAIAAEKTYLQIVTEALEKGATGVLVEAFSRGTSRISIGPPFRSARSSPSKQRLHIKR